jgi:chromate transporter
MSEDQVQPNSQAQRLRELATVFLKLGTIAFGGPAAHIAMIDHEVVNRHQWMSREKLLDLLGITHLIPGPNSTELAIHIGYERAGWRGLVVAGACFILPAMLIVWALAAVYVRYQTLPQAAWLLYGIKPVIIAVVLQALWQLGKKAAKDSVTLFVASAAVLGCFLDMNEIMILLAAAVVVILVRLSQSKLNITGAFLFSLLAQVSSRSSVAAGAATASWSSVFLIFFKVGAVLYGSGYVLLAFLQRDLVERNHWLTSQQLLDAVAIGQVTPGPVFTTATFIGYLLAGNAGAVAGTVGIFLPAFVFVWLVNPWVAKLRQAAWTSAVLDGVNAASLGLMIGVSYILARTALVDSLTVVVALLSLVAVFRFKLNSAWLVLFGGVVGLLFHQ